MQGDSARDLAGDALRDVLAVNVVGPQDVNRIVVPHMDPGSSIVYVGSTLSEKAVAGAFSYVTSKHAVIGMMRATCQDLSGCGVHTAAVCPGFTDTEMLRSHIGDNAEAMAFMQGKTGYGRLIEPVEIARVIMFVATNPVVNGAVLHANLGQIET
jgi:NAD(P)-dependent dehydrogenase (short-subunit alcohol dehydrogenase family)